MSEHEDEVFRDVVFLEQDIQAIISEGRELLYDHWKEVAHYQDIELNPDWDQYLLAEQSALTRVYTARRNHKLIAYCIFFVRPNMHYRQSKQAVQDVVFVDKKERGIGKKLISWCDKQLRREGVQAVYHHVKKAHNFGPMLETMGYELVDLIYARRLDKER